MSLWSAIIAKLKEMLKMFSGNTIGQALDINIVPVISTEMENAILLWDKMYKGKPDWVHEPSNEDPSPPALGKA